MFIVILIMIPSSISFIISGIFFVDLEYLPELFSIGGYVFIIGLLALIPLVAIGMLLTSLLSKEGLAIFIPILLLMIFPVLVGFLPIVVRHEWPLLFSYSYYFEELSSAWISNVGLGLSSIATPYAGLFGLTIGEMNLEPIHIIVILILLTVAFLIISTLYLERTDIN